MYAPPEGNKPASGPGYMNKDSGILLCSIDSALQSRCIVEKFIKMIALTVSVQEETHGTSK
jgi:hypothetical protein